ncbi:hypothetical protein F5146DRAFT_269530 [Armillaria mellea]|nr:hypothetical protein F5146DRAFT_269530 [Armillaria mellea]
MASSIEQPVIIIAMGVSGTGKSTLGSALAESLGLPFVDGDDLHPAANIAKMSSGQPLTDADREPWLALIRETGVEKVPVVMACSALKRHYRDILRGKDGIREGGKDVFCVYQGIPRGVAGPNAEAPGSIFSRWTYWTASLRLWRVQRARKGSLWCQLEELTEAQVAQAKEELLSMVVNS